MISLICWALLATIIISYASSYFGSAGHQGSSMTVEYSVFKDMVAQDQVEMVQFDNAENILHITLQDGCTYTAEDGTVYTKSTDADGNAVYTFTDQSGNEQAARLDDHLAAGAMCFVVAGFGNGDVFRIPWEVWRDMKTHFGHKYATPEELEDYKVPLGRNGVLLLLD